MRKLITATIGFILLSSIASTAGDNMQAFPLPAKDQLRHVLQLPARGDEANFKVELIVGKTVKIDNTNQYFFGGHIQKETIAGWGFPRYIVKELGPMAGTLKAVDPNAPKVDRFIRLGGEPYLIRYNSRLPIVVYAPEGVEVRYRIWRTDVAMKNMPAG